MNQHPHLRQRLTGRIAFVMSNAIGDTLVSMIVVRNLLLNHFDVTVFGSPAYALKRWFPRVTIRPLPSAEQRQLVLSAFDTVIQMQVDQPIRDLGRWHPNLITLHDVEFGKREGCMGERFADFCRQDLALPMTSIVNGIVPPTGLTHRRHVKRVLIHPEASTIDKKWIPLRYVKLAHGLQRDGFEPIFVISPQERDSWQNLEAEGLVAPNFGNLGALAECVYESGWFIGNDSGIGHLASNLHIPTLSLFRRRNVSKRWRPVWGEARVVLPWQWVPSAFLKERLWRHTLTCRRVLRSFTQLQKAQIDSSFNATRSLPPTRPARRPPCIP